MRFLYLRGPNGHPVGCLATRLIPPEGNIKEPTVAFAISTCNPLDHFKREQAKSLAAGRCVTAPLGTLAVSPNGSTKKNILLTITRRSNLPQRAREAARFMLASMDYVEATAAERKSRGPNVGDPPKAEVVAVTEAKRHYGEGGTPRPLDGPQCNCKPGRITSGLRWHSTTTPGCLRTFSAASHKAKEDQRIYAAAMNRHPDSEAQQ